METILADPRYDERYSGLSTPSQIISGQGVLVSEDNVHENGNIFDEVVMIGPSLTIQSRPGIITRIYFLDEDGDIVATEFAGTGVLKITLDPTTYISPATAAIGEATPYLLFGSDSEFGHVIVTGGDLGQTNGSAISVRLDGAFQGFDSILTLDGIGSNGIIAPRSPINAVFTTGDGNVFIRIE